jgi:hypothetical protein
MLEEWQQQEGHQFWCKQTCNNCYLQVNWLQVRASWAKPHICSTKRAQHTAYHLLVGWLAGWLAGVLHIICWQGEATGVHPPC